MVDHSYENKRGRKTELWGTPDVTGRNYEAVLLIMTDGDWLRKNYFIHVMTLECKLVIVDELLYQMSLQSKKKKICRLQCYYQDLGRGHVEMKLSCTIDPYESHML